MKDQVGSTDAGREGYRKCINENKKDKSKPA